MTRRPAYRAPYLPDELLDAAAAGRMLGLTAAQVVRLVAMGKLPKPDVDGLFSCRGLQAIKGTPEQLRGFVQDVAN